LNCLLYRLRRNDVAEQRLGIFHEIQTTYGPQAGRVMGEIGLYPMEQSLARTALSTPTRDGAPDPTAARNFIALSTASGMKDKDLPVIAEENQNRLMKEIRGESPRLSVMREVMAHVMPGNDAYAAAVTRAEGETARLLRLTNGDKEATLGALDYGVDKLTGSNFALVYEKAQVDGNTLLAALMEAGHARLADFDEALPGYADGQKKELRLTQLRRKGVWINAPDGDGFVLVDPQGQYAIIDTKGNYFRVRAKDAKNIAAGVKSDTSLVQGGS